MRRSYWLMILPIIITNKRLHAISTDIETFHEIEIFHDRDRLIPSFFMRERSVPSFNPSTLAAPRGPLTIHPVSSSTA